MSARSAIWQTIGFAALALWMTLTNDHDQWFWMTMGCLLSAIAAIWCSKLSATG